MSIECVLSYKSVVAGGKGENCHTTNIDTLAGQKEWTCNCCIHSWFFSFMAARAIAIVWEKRGHNTTIDTLAGQKCNRCYIHLLYFSPTEKGKPGLPSCHCTTMVVTHYVTSQFFVTIFLSQYVASCAGQCNKMWQHFLATKQKAKEMLPCCHSSSHLPQSDFSLLQNWEIPRMRRWSWPAKSIIVTNAVLVVK